MKFWVMEGEGDCFYVHIKYMETCCCSSCWLHGEACSAITEYRDLSTVRCRGNILYGYIFIFMSLLYGLVFAAD